jgi:hypothetical protein
MLMGDIERVIEVGRRGHAKSEHSHLQFDERKSRLLGAHCIHNKGSCAFVAEVGGEIVGFLLGQDQELPYAKARFATDIVVYSERAGAGRKLIERFTKWGLEERKVDMMWLGVSFGGDEAKRVGAMYRRMGFSPVGGIFTKQRQA